MAEQVNAISKASFYAVAIKKDGIIEDVRIAFGSVAPTAVRDRACEEILIGSDGNGTGCKNRNALRTLYGELLAPLDDTRSCGLSAVRVGAVVGGFHQEGAGALNRNHSDCLLGFAVG